MGVVEKRPGSRHGNCSYLDGRSANPTFARRAFMTLFEFLALLIVAGICGGVARSIVGYSHGGCLTSILLGFIGALLGSWLARQAGLPELIDVTICDQSFPDVLSIIRAEHFVAVLTLI